MITMGSRYVCVFHVVDYVYARSRARVHSKHGITCVNYNDKCEFVGRVRVQRTGQGDNVGKGLVPAFV